MDTVWDFVQFVVDVSPGAADWDTLDGATADVRDARDILTAAVQSIEVRALWCACLGVAWLGLSLGTHCMHA